MSRVLSVKSLVIVVAVIVASWFAWSVLQGPDTIQIHNTLTTSATPMLVKKTFINDAFEARILYPKDVKPGQEIPVKVCAKARNDYVLTGLVIRAYPHTLPGLIVVEKKGRIIYENSTTFSPPVKRFSTMYRIKLPEDLEGLGLSIVITPIKPRKPIIVHLSEPIIVNIKVAGVTSKTSTLPLINKTVSVKLPPRPWSNLSISTNKKVYEVGEHVRITLTNKGSKTVKIKPSIPWVIRPYNPEKNRISYFCIYEPPRDDKWIVLNPGSSVTWIWNQTSTWGFKVEPGNYAVVLVDIEIWVEGESKPIGILGGVEDVNATFTIVEREGRNT